MVLLSVVWTGALLGVGFRVFWNHAPRWLYAPIYFALGWAAVFFFVPEAVVVFLGFVAGFGVVSS